MVVGHIESSLDRQPPFPAKVSLMPCLCLGRNERHEIVAFAYLPADLLIPEFPAAQLAFVIPHLQTEGNERLLECSRRLAIRGGVTQEDGGYMVGVERFDVCHVLQVPQRLPVSKYHARPSVTDAENRRLQPRAAN